MNDISSHNWSLNTETGNDVNHDDDDLLLENDNNGRPHLDGQVMLTGEETQRLVECLTRMTDLLTQNIDITRLARPVRRPRQATTIWSRVQDFFWHSIRRFTGGLGIASTILLQLVCLVMLSLVDCLPRTAETKATALRAGSICMIVIQSINLLVIILVSVQVFHQVHSRRMSRMLLLQSFVATILLFAGIYTATYRLNRSSWKFVDRSTDPSPVQIVTVDYIEFLFFSVSTATLCGAAKNVPIVWYTSLFVCIQMLLSFVYFTSVLSPSGSEPNIRQGALSDKLNALRTRLRNQRRETLDE